MPAGGGFFGQGAGFGFNNDRDRAGILGGVQIGYNWQFSPGSGFVFGVEADIQPFIADMAAAYGWADHDQPLARRGHHHVEGPELDGLDATRAIVMLAGIYYGAMYGGSTTAILLNIPGEVASVPVGEAFRARFRNPYAVSHRADLHGDGKSGCKSCD